MSPTLDLPMTGTDRDLLINRVFDAPREQVFRAWTEPEHILRWWGPYGFATTACEIDLRLGGAWRACMEAPDWGEMWMQGVFLEIAEPSHLVCTFAWEDPDGVPGHETMVSVTFSSLGEQTLFTFQQAVFESFESRGGHEEIWSSAFDRLAEFLASSQMSNRR